MLGSLAVTLAQDKLVPSGDPDLAPFIIVSALGFVIALFGHIIRSNWAIGTGLALVFIGVVLLPLALHGDF